LVDELLRHGTYVEVISDGSSGSDHLMHAADSGRKMRFEFYRALAPTAFQNAHPMPETGAIPLHSLGMLVKSGTLPNGSLAQISGDGTMFHLITRENSGLVSHVRAETLRLLAEYVSEECPEL